MLGQPLELMPARIIFIWKENLYFLYRVLGESISSEGAPNISCALALDLKESSRFLRTEIFLVQKYHII